MPGLDGLRAIAVLAVIAYHLGFGWANGGLLGVGVFFTLSGYLITDLLLDEQDRLGALQLKEFWLRRARRLLPALFSMLAVVVIWAALLHPSELSSLRSYVLAAAVYVSNWSSIAWSASYAASSSQPSPLGHLWSLAVEEQFYLLWPFLLWLGLRFVRPRHRLAGVTMALAIVSTILMAVLYQPGYDPTRVYEGTDTRAAGLLIGAALAMVWPSRKLKADITLSHRRVIDGAGIIGLGIIAILIWQTGFYSAFLYRGGILLLSVATALVVAACAHPAGWLGKVLGLGPLRWLGVRSYGIYLWHYPIIVFTTAFNHTPTVQLALIQLGAIFAVAALSWRFIEDPIRRGALATLWSHLRRRQWDVVSRRTWGTLGGVALVFIIAGCALTTAPSSANVGPSTTPTSALPLLLPWTKVQPSKSQTACHTIAYIGDSTSEGMISPIYIINPAQRLAAQMNSVGATRHKFRISGARSIVETLPGQQNGYEVAKQLHASGFRGCWMIALGTNDTANVAIGSPVTRSDRIKEMMSVIGNQRVLWVTVKTLLNGTAYSEANMQLWNQSLRQACPAHKHMRVFDWAKLAKPSWFQSDLTHYTSTGYEHRAHLTAIGLADAFPASGVSSHKACFVT
jgi:peptidoglycan/LPS O-acetylase OafA/YrhL